MRGRRGRRERRERRGEWSGVEEIREQEERR